MQGISNEYIKNAIDELVGSLGIKESIPADTVMRLIDAGRTKECVEAMANYLGLPISVDLQYVPATYQQPHSPGGNGDIRFESNALARTDGAGRGIEGITGQVCIPDNLPFFGTPQLKGFRVTVRISDNCRRHPRTFMAIMAHELSHVLLHSLWHTEKSNEIYTDVAAMVLGFCEVMSIGRKVVTTEDHGSYTQTLTTTYGYLADEQFYFARKRVNGILEGERARWQDLTHRTSERLASCRKQVHQHRRVFCELNKLIECLDRNPATRKIRREHALKLVEVHGPNYVEELASTLTSNETKLGEVELLYSGRFREPCHYTPSRFDSLREFNDSLYTLASASANDCMLVSNDVVALRGYAGFFERLKIKRQVRHAVRQGRGKAKERR